MLVLKFLAKIFFPRIMPWINLIENENNIGFYDIDLAYICLSLYNAYLLRVETT
jgi:hypothetical protein